MGVGRRGFIGSLVAGAGAVAAKGYQLGLRFAAWAGGESAPPPPPPPPPPVPENAVCFTANSANSTIRLDIPSGIASGVQLEYCTDRVHWSSYVGGTTITLSNAGDELYLRAVDGVVNRFSVGSSSGSYCRFYMSGSVNGSGDLVYLLDKAGSLTSLADRSYCFCYLFYSCSALKTSPLLQFVTLSERCYYNMFAYSGVTAAPEIPATTFDQYCCYYMFYSCTSLISSPTELYASSMPAYCCCMMFYGCTSLTSSPRIDATVFNDYSCYGMFLGCRSLTTAYGKDDASVLGEYCFAEMFSGCSALSALSGGRGTLKPSGGIYPQYCCYRMFKGCSSLLQPVSAIGGANGISTIGRSAFYEMYADCSSLSARLPISLHIKDPNAARISVGRDAFRGMFTGCTSLIQGQISWTSDIVDVGTGAFNAMFSGCTSLTGLLAVPILKFYPLQTNTTAFCRMFYGCTSLTSAPELPANVLSESCYEQMFYGCTALKSAPALPAPVLTKTCYFQMFYNCTNLVTPPNILATSCAEETRSILSGAIGGMFINCSSLSRIPTFNFYELPEWFGTGVFQGCTSLTTVDLPFTSMAASDTYMSSWFQGCTNLSDVTLRLSDWPVMTSSWLDGVAANGTFRCPTALGTDETITRDSSHCPVGWTVVNID